MQRGNVEELKRRLSSVLWLGGPPDCGKTSIARELSLNYGLSVYHFDRHEPAHFGRADPVHHPALYAAHPERMSTEERWLGSTPAQMARATVQSWTERFGMAIDDVLALSRTSSIIAEGPGFFPDCVAPVLAEYTKALWLVPTPAFKRESAIRRDKPGSRWETTDPERAQQNLIERDLIMGEHIHRTATELGLTVYVVDGTVGIDEMCERVARYFRTWLP